MPLTKMDGYEVMYSANQFPPRVWQKSGGAFVIDIFLRVAQAEPPP